MNGPSIDDRVALDRIRLFFGHAKGNMASLLMGAIVLGIVLASGGVAPSAIAAWGLLLAAACAVVLRFERQVDRIGISADNCRRLLHIRIALGGTVSLLYGMAGWLLPEAATRVEDLFLFIVLSTVTTLGALSFTVMPAHYLTINLACLVPLMAHYALRWVMQRDGLYLVLLGTTAVWQVLVMLKTRKVSATAVHSIALTQRLHDEIEEHKRTKESMRTMALHDALTGLGNRRYFDDMLSRTLGNARRDRSRFGVLVIDLDRFKSVNDQHGHAVGDALLQSVARRLQGAVRSGDFCARLGGDEFAVLLVGVADAPTVGTLADKLRAVLQPPHVLGTVVAQGGASVGWAVHAEDGQDAAALLAVADARMYRQKQARHATACGEALAV